MNSPSPTTEPGPAPALTDCCLSLFFDAPGGGEKVRTQLLREVGSWRETVFLNASQRHWMRAYEAHRLLAGFTSVHLLVFSSSVSLHTEVVQVILTAAQAAEVAWPAAANWLRTQLGELLRPQPPREAQPTLLGHSLVYYVDLPHPTSTPPALLEAARAVYRDEPRPILRPVMARQLLGLEGQLLLLDYSAAAGQGLLYLVLGRAGRVRPGFADRIYASPDAMLVNLDVFVHKANVVYGNLDAHYDHYQRLHLQPFKAAITQLLEHLNAPQRANQLQVFSQQLATFSHTQWDLSRVEYSLQQQFQGLLRRYPTGAMPAVPQLYRTTLEAYLQETRALVQQHQLVLENARLAIALTEAQQNKYTGLEQRRFGQAIALAGIFFGAYTIFDVPLLTAWGVMSVWQFAIRLGLSLLPVILILAGYVFIYKRYRKLRQLRLSYRYMLWPLPASEKRYAKVDHEN